MSVYTDIKSSRRLVWIGAILGYAVAIGIGLANLAAGEGTPLSALAFAGVFSLPPTLAILSLDRRPALLTVASMGAVIQGVLMITSIGLIELVPAILWYMAAQRRPLPAKTPRGAAWIRPLLAVATVVPLLAMVTHLDPVCTVTSSDGSVIRTYEYDQATTGWSLNLGSSTSTSESDGETTTCATNTMTAWEAGLSLALSILHAVLIAVWWPTAAKLADDPVPSGRRA